MISPPQLPDFPWDSLAAARHRAAAHPDGIVDLSVGTPVDPTPSVVTAALIKAAQAPGYPTTVGTVALREAITGWMHRRRGADVSTDAVLPLVGTKQAVALLPFLLGASGSLDFPPLAYPTYEVGAILAGMRPAPTGSTVAWGPSKPTMMWLNSPANPNGAVLGVAHLRKVVSWAREREVIVVSDECYAGFEWEAAAPSLLADDVCEGDHTGLLVLHSLSKRSNMAGYRAGFLAGDAALVNSVLGVAKHAGMMMPTPVQAAATAAYNDDQHAQEQIDRYRRRREILRAALVAAGFHIDNSEAGLYLWATEFLPARTTIARLAEIGILAAPGDFYGIAGQQHVRIALTATDERIEQAAIRVTNELQGRV